MKGKKAILGIVMFFAILTGSAWAGMAVPVSPGGGTEVTGQNCPTFSWSASEGALSYMIEVYEQMTTDSMDWDTMRGISNPVIAKEITAPALSWSPSSGECLSRGMRYVWYVRGVDAKGEGQWSEGKGFQIEAAALSIEQKEAVQEVVKGYLSGESSGSGTTSGTSTSASAAGVITPLATEDGSNSFFGDGAGANPSFAGYDDTFIGFQAGNSNTTGTANSFLGSLAGSSNTTGSSNSFLGFEAGALNNTGHSNSFLGYRAGRENTAGHSNSFLGYGAGRLNKTGHSNSFLGLYAGYSNTTGNQNVFLGMKAGYSETGSNMLYIDNCFTGGGCTQPLIKGDFAARTLQIDGSLTIVTVATPSDIRYKKEINPLGSSLEKVLQLQGVTYEWDKDKVSGTGFTDGRQIGLIAQEVEQVLPELVHTDSKGYKTLSYDKLGPVLIEAVKEQQREIEEKEAHYTAALKEKDAHIEKLEKAIKEQQHALASVMARLASLENSAKTIALK